MVFDPGDTPEGVSGHQVCIVEAKARTGVCAIRVRARPMPNRFAALIEESVDFLQPLMSENQNFPTFWKIVRSGNVLRRFL